MSVLLLVECTAKKFVDGKCLDIGELKQKLQELFNEIPNFDYWNEVKYVRELGRKNKLDMIRSAERIYCGARFVLIKYVRDLLARAGLTVDFFIFSGRYGIIESSRKIIPYDADLAELEKNPELRTTWLNHVFKQSLGELFKQAQLRNYEIAIIGMGRRYYEYFRKFLEECGVNITELAGTIFKLKYEYENLLDLRNLAYTIDLLVEQGLYLTVDKLRTIIKEYSEEVIESK